MAGFQTKTFLKYDDYMTPYSAWENIIHLIPKNNKIWAPFYGDGKQKEHFAKLGFDIIHKKKDFFIYEPENYNIIIDNPPFTKKKEVFTRLKELDLNKSLKKDELNKKEFNILQKYVLGSLYVGDPVNHPPVRNDYTREIIDFKDYNKLSEKDKDNNNYLVNKNKSNKFFSFGNYKSKDTYGIKKIKLSEKINKIINIWLKYNKSKHLFLDSLGQPIKANGISKLLYKIFEPSGKKISSSLLRHIFVSETFPPQTEERQKIASNMMHSVAMQSGVYSKNDIKD